MDRASVGQHVQHVAPRGHGTPSGSRACERFAPVKLAPYIEAPVRSAPVRFAFTKVVPVRVAFVKFAPLRVAREKIAPLSFALANIAPFRRASDISAPARFALVKFAPLSVVRMNMAYFRIELEKFTRVKSRPVKLQLVRSTPANASGASLQFAAFGAGVAVVCVIAAFLVLDDEPDVSFDPPHETALRDNKAIMNAAFFIKAR